MGTGHITLSLATATRLSRFSITNLMRALCGILIGCLILAGCNSSPDGSGGRLDRASPQSEYFDRNKAEVFAALAEVLEIKGYSIGKRAAAQGILEGEGPLMEGDELGGSRQFLFTAKLREAGDGITGVELLIREVVEGDFRAGAVSEALQGHGRYEGIFEALEAKLGQGSWMPPIAGTP